MRAALVVHRVVPGVETNLATMIDLAGQAADKGANLVLFSEAALTGLINNDNPAHDLLLGQPVPGTATSQLGAFSHERGVWLAVGLLEQENKQLYDTALLFDPQGQIALHYRRIQPQWHGKDANPDVYRQGSELGKVETPYGSMAFLICGDLFNDRIVQRVRVLAPDWLLFPFARCFGDGSYNQAQWENKELPEYVARIKTIGRTALMTNYLADQDMLGGAFGGAMCVSGSGHVLASLPLGQKGMLVVDL